MELLSLLSTIGFALAWQRWQKTSASLAVLHAVSAILIILFVCSLLDLLLPAAVLLIAAGIMLTALESLRLFREKISLPIPVGIFALLSVLYWMIHSGSSLFYYDEYSHWGVYLREMLARNELWGSDTNSMHPRYLPGTSLWQYFFAVFSRRPEGAAYLAQFALLLTPLLVLWEKTTWKQYQWHAGILVLVVVAVFNFGHGFTSLYVDHILGAWLAGILLNFHLDKSSRSFSQLLSYLLPLSVLVLTKTTGVFFALAGAGIIALLVLAMTTSDGTLLARTIRWRRAIAFTSATAILCLSMLFAWSANRDSVGVVGSSKVSTAAVISHLVARESVLDEAQQTELTRRFIDVVLHQQISKDEVSAQYNAFSYSVMAAYTDRFRLTTASLMGFSLIAIFFLWYAIVPRHSRQSWVIAAGSIWLATVLYIAALYFGILYMSTSDRGLILSSYVRYAHSMLLPTVLYCFAALVPAFSGQQAPLVKLGDKIEIKRNSLIFSIALAALLIFEPPYLKPAYVTQQAPEFRLQTEVATTQLRAEIGQSSLWILFPNDLPNGFLGQVLQYQLSPGRTYVERDVTDLLQDQASLREELRNWEYAWFPAADPDLDAALERLIESPVSERLYRIVTTGNQIRFEAVAGVFGG